MKDLLETSGLDLFFLSVMGSWWRKTFICSDMTYVNGLRWLLYGEQDSRAEWKEETQMRDGTSSQGTNCGGLD